jgi:biopolymer transport protein ExbD
MRKLHHYRLLQTKEEPELNVTSFLNLMVVLVPFLLITAVFSRLTIVELTLPSSSGGPSATEIGFRPEVIVREEGIEVTNGRSVIAAIPRGQGEYDARGEYQRAYDLETLTSYMLSLKQDHPEVDDISVLLESHIPYDYLIQVMDAVRSVRLEDEESESGFTHFALFTAIAVGDAP